MPSIWNSFPVAIIISRKITFIMSNNQILKHVLSVFGSSESCQRYESTLVEICAGKHLFCADMMWLGASCSVCGFWSATFIVLHWKTTRPFAMTLWTLSNQHSLTQVNHCCRPLWLQTRSYTKQTLSGIYNCVLSGRSQNVLNMCETCSSKVTVNQHLRI